MIVFLFDRGCHSSVTSLLVCETFNVVSFYQRDEVTSYLYDGACSFSPR